MEDEVKEEFHPAVQLMLARMESNPEEFMNGGKFRHFVDSHDKYLQKAERVALTKAFGKIHMDELHAKLMKGVLEPYPVLTGGPSFIEALPILKFGEAAEHIQEYLTHAAGINR